MGTHIGLELVGIRPGLCPADHESGQPLTEFSVVDAHHRGLDDAGMVSEQVLDFQRENVLAAGDDHVVVAAVDEPQAGLVEMPSVASG